MILFGLLIGCPRPLPPHLAVQTDPTTAQGPVSTLTEALSATLAGDPLARSPRLLSVQTLGDIEGTAPLVRFGERVRSVEAGDAPMGDALRPLAWHHDGIGVPLARGYLYRQVEHHLAGLRGEDALPLVELLTPLRTAEADASLTRDPLAFLEDDRAKRVYGERQVLEGWLHVRSAPVQPIQEALRRPEHTGLSGSPTGRLLLARDAEGDAATGWEALEQATLLALTRTAADRDREQAAWAEVLLEARESLGTDDPEGLLLERAFDGLLANAADDDTAGAALVALAARRWRGSCPDRPCDGLDRTGLFAAATDYGSRARRVATVWQVIALKDALDGMEAGRDSVLFPRLVRDLVDVLHGTGARPIDASLLMKSRPDAGTWLALSRATGADSALDWGMARNALAAHGVRVVDEALTEHPDGPLRPLLARIRSRIAL